ncbi:hypothetical protein Tco_1016137 [Tanacetum coccineum]|uniref:Xylulose kinase-1 n=1 Tax=Tanacetum coccineum TaxID=301880 RepID=A0ABQ5FQ67_9ASTR
MSTLTFADTHNLIAFLDKPAESDGFHKIIDFLNANQICYALMINPTIYTSCIKQFWIIAKVKIVNEEAQIQALVDGKRVIVTEKSIRRDLHLQDAEGTYCLSNATIFAKLERMGAKTTAWNEFSSTIASAIICLATNQPFNFSKYIFDNMVKNLEGGVKFLMYPRPGHKFSSRVTPLFPTMLAQPQKDVEVLLQEETPTEIVEDLSSGEKGEKETSTAQVPVGTASPEVTEVSTAAQNLVYIRRSASKAKDKGKAIMEEHEPLKKIKKRVQVQMSVDEELAKKIQKEEQARAMAEQEQERINFEAALEYHALKNKPVSVAQARKNMITYLINQGGYKQSYFKKMSYEDIRSIFKKVCDQVNTFIPKDSEFEKEVMKRQKLDEEEAVDYEKEKEELRMRLTVVPDEEEFVDPEILHAKFPIVDWESQSLGSMHVYKIIRADGNTSYHKHFESMLKSFDRQDLMVLHRLVMERFEDNTPEGYNLMLWGDLKILVDPKEDDDIWKNQH